MKAFARLISFALLGALALGGCAIVDYEQRRWIFMPVERSWAPGEAAAEGMAQRWIEFVSEHPEQRGQPARLHALWLPQPAADAPVLLFLHGVHWDVRASAPRMRQLHKLGFSVLGVDYRGFGRSSPTMPSETLVAEDVRQAWTWMRREHQAARRFIFGHSLGGAVAVRLAAEVDDEAGILVEGGFTSALDVLRSTRWGWLPVAPLMTQHFDAAALVDQINAPLLVVHAAQDRMIDPALGRALYARARSPKRFVLVDGAVHENATEVGEAEYREALQTFFGLGL